MVLRRAGDVGMVVYYPSLIPVKYFMRGKCKLWTTSSGVVAMLLVEINPKEIM